MCQFCLENTNHKAHNHEMQEVISHIETCNEVFKVRFDQGCLYPSPSEMRVSSPHLIVVNYLELSSCLNLSDRFHLNLVLVHLGPIPI